MREKTGNQAVFVEVVDMSSIDSVRSFAEKWEKKSLADRKIDILMNNAGLTASSKVTTADGFELVYQSNFLSQFLLTTALLRSSCFAPDARIIQTSSAGIYGSGPMEPADLNSTDMLGKLQEGQDMPVGDAFRLYQRSKSLQAIWSRELQTRLVLSKDWRNVVVQCCNPGWVRTEIWNDPKGLAAYPTLHKVIVVVDRLVGISVAAGAVVPIFLATSPEVADPAVRGKYWDRLGWRWVPAWMEDAKLRDDMWKRWEMDAGIQATFG